MTQMGEDDLRRAELAVKRNARAWQEAVAMREVARKRLDEEYAEKRRAVLPAHNRTQYGEPADSGIPASQQVEEDRREIVQQDELLAKDGIDTAALRSLDSDYLSRVAVLEAWRPSAGRIHLLPVSPTGVAARTVLPPMTNVTRTTVPYISQFTSEESNLFNSSQLAVHSDLTDKSSGQIGAQTRVTKFNDWCQYDGENYEQARNTGILTLGVPAIARPTILGIRANITCQESSHFFNREIEPFPARRSNWVASASSVLMFGVARRFFDAPFGLLLEENLAVRNFDRPTGELPGSFEHSRGTTLTAEAVLPGPFTSVMLDDCSVAFVGIRQYVRAWGSNIKFDVNAFCKWTVNFVEIGVIN